MYTSLNMPDPTLLASPRTGASLKITQSPVMGISNRILDFKTRWYFEMEKKKATRLRSNKS